MVIHFSIPKVPVGPNGPGGLFRSHWSKRTKMRSDWRVLVAGALSEQGFNRPWRLVTRGKHSWLSLEPGDVLHHGNRRRRVVIRQLRQRKLDTGNAWAAVKPIEDALVDVGFLKDDAEKWCALQVYQEKADKSGERTEITIEDIP